jgi:hypothetical protein
MIQGVLVGSGLADASGILLHRMPVLGAGMQGYSRQWPLHVIQIND